MRIVPLSCLSSQLSPHVLPEKPKSSVHLPLPLPWVTLLALALHTDQPAVEIFTPRLPFMEKDEKERAKLIHVTV